MPWYQTWGSKYVDYTSSEEWTKCMGDDRVITLEDCSAGWGTYTAVSSPKILPATPDRSVLYDLQGHRLSKAPTKGLFIQDGQKILKK